MTTKPTCGCWRYDKIKMEGALINVFTATSKPDDPKPYAIVWRAAVWQYCPICGQKAEEVKE